MSKIDLVIETAHPAHAMAVLRRVEPAVSLAELASRISARRPVVEYVLYNNDHVEVAAKLRALLRDLRSNGAVTKIFLLGPDERFDAIDQATREIPTETLRNMLDEADADFE